MSFVSDDIETHLYDSTTRNYFLLKMTHHLLPWRDTSTCYIHQCLPLPLPTLLHAWICWKQVNRGTSIPFSSDCWLHLNFSFCISSNWNFRSCNLASSCCKVAKYCSFRSIAEWNWSSSHLWETTRLCFVTLSFEVCMSKMILALDQVNCRGAHLARSREHEVQSPLKYSHLMFRMSQNRNLWLTVLHHIIKQTIITSSKFSVVYWNSY